MHWEMHNSSLIGPIGGALMIVSSLAMFWAVRGYKDARTFRLLASASLVGGLAWFVPSEPASVLFTLAGAALSVGALITLMIRTWRQASVHQ